MKKVKITTKYPEDVSWISFDKIYKLEFCAWLGFQYDSISDETIQEALNHAYLNQIDISIDWEDDHALRENEEIREELKHPLRIAKLVETIINGGAINPVDFDTYAIRCRSFICNGHHRIRALQYLKYDCFPSYCSGITKIINSIIEK